MNRRLAQFDLVKPKFPKEDSRMEEFYASTGYVNGLAEQHPGFIWRETEENQQLLDQLWGEGYLYTLSLWKDVESLKAFLYETPHKTFMQRGREWFDSVSRPRVVLWWVEDGHIPSLREAHSRLTHLYEVGPSYEAFDLHSSELPTVLY
ncbi:DUF3291 domain-containing protein [Pseudomonas fakonensis]|uniref:DUF3291 domain-containing protein n=1 Tax=Pseudomonas fakonensis TaxID=2842355 RepID=A0ABX8N5Y3_9PSED|nr:DUF3291 domain-containing protein [Pseudomonas fakonensis]QXH51088.1 DUF3291 domain-containing protein [Pseudomonas fakonensis]